MHVCTGTLIAPRTEVSQSSFLAVCSRNSKRWYMKRHLRTVRRDVLCTTWCTCDPSRRTVGKMKTSKLARLAFYLQEAWQCFVLRTSLLFCYLNTVSMFHWRIRVMDVDVLCTYLSYNSLSLPVFCLVHRLTAKCLRDYIVFGKAIMDLWMGTNEIIFGGFNVNK